MGAGYSLDVWLASQFREVEESGARCTKIVLRSVDNGTPWQTWHVIYEGEGATDLAVLLEEMKNVTAGLADQFPVGKNQVMFIAFDADTCELSRFPTDIMGKNKSASAKGLIENEMGQSVSQTMTAFADTFRQVLGPVNAQFSLMMRHTEQLQNTIITQGEYINALQARRIQEMEQASEDGPTEGPTQQLVATVKEHAPVLMEILKVNAETNKASKLHDLAQAGLKVAANGQKPAVAAPVNGTTPGKA